MIFRIVFIVSVFCLCGPAFSAYKCTDLKGVISYQQLPCANDVSSKTIDTSRYASNTNSKSTQQHLDAVRSKLKDPDSARFYELHSTGNSTCGFVNAKNSYGGFTGKKPFVYLGVGDQNPHILMDDEVYGTKILFHGVWISSDDYVKQCFSSPVVVE